MKAKRRPESKGSVYPLLGMIAVGLYLASRTDLVRSFIADPKRLADDASTRPPSDDGPAQRSAGLPEPAGRPNEPRASYRGFLQARSQAARYGLPVPNRAGDTESLPTNQSSEIADAGARVTQDSAADTVEFDAEYLAIVETLVAADPADETLDGEDLPWARDDASKDRNVFRRIRRRAGVRDAGRMPPDRVLD